MLNFEKENEPNIAGNPLLDHTEGKVNTIKEEKVYWVKNSMDHVRILMI